VRRDRAYIEWGRKRVIKLLMNSAFVIFAGFVCLVKTAAAGRADDVARIERNPLTWQIYKSPIRSGLYVRIEVNGSGPYTFCIDTGAGVCAIDAHLANRLRLPAVPHATTKMSDGQRSKQAHYVVADLDLIRYQTPFMMPLAVVPLKELGYDGVIGMNMLSQFVLTLDGPGQTCSLTAKRAFTPPGVPALGLSLAGDAVAMRGKIEGRSVSLTIDTGLQDGINVRRSVFNRLGMSRKAIASAKGGLYQYSMYNSMPVELYRLQRLDLGNVTINYPIVATHTNEKSDGHEKDAVIGWQIFSRVKSIFDFPGKRLYLITGPQISEPMIFNRTGIWNYGDLVTEVSAGSSAERQGVKPGDRIIALNGKRYEDTTPVDVDTAIIGTTGDRLVLTLRRGGQVMKKRIELREILWNHKIPWPVKPGNTAATDKAIVRGAQ